MKVQRPKGTVDILPGESGSWEKVESIARNFFKRAKEKYGDKYLTYIKQG